MAWATKALLSLPIESDSDRSLPLNMLFCRFNVLCRGWHSLSVIDRSLLRVLFLTKDAMDSSSMATTEQAFSRDLKNRHSIVFLNGLEYNCVLILYKKY